MNGCTAQPNGGRRCAASFGVPDLRVTSQFCHISMKTLLTLGRVGTCERGGIWYVHMSCVLVNDESPVPKNEALE